jgi:hypothetical protein
MTEVCREFGVSRKTGYKIFDRYKEHGLEALGDRSRRPIRYANQLPAQIETLIVQLKAEKPHWGARTIRELLVRRLDSDVRVPAKSTIHAVLDRHDLVRRGGGPRHCARGTPLSQGAAGISRAADRHIREPIAIDDPCMPVPIEVRLREELFAVEPLAPVNSTSTAISVSFRSCSFSVLHSTGLFVLMLREYLCSGLP